MNTDSTPNDWECIDSWWSAYTQSQSVTQVSASPKVLDENARNTYWGELDSWWQTRMDTSPVAPHPVSTRILSAEQLTRSWDELDPWWDIYTEGGRSNAEQIADLLQRSNTEWAESSAPFDTDPLAAELTLDQSRHRGVAWLTAAPLL